MTRLLKSETFRPSDPASETAQGRRRRNRLTEVRIDEISIVDSPAIKLNGGGNFLLIKRDTSTEQEEEMVDQLAAILWLEKSLGEIKQTDPEFYKQMEDHPEDFDFQEVPEGIKISKKVHEWKNLPAGRKTDPRTPWPPGETSSHKFDFTDNKWHPKRSRDSFGRYR